MGRPLAANSRSAEIWGETQRGGAAGGDASHQPPALSHERHGGALAPRDDEPGQADQVLRLADLDGNRADPSEALQVLTEGALQGKHADADALLLLHATHDGGRSVALAECN